MGGSSSICPGTDPARAYRVESRLFVAWLKAALDGRDRLSLPTPLLYGFSFFAPISYLGVGGSIHTSNTLHHLKELGLDTQRAPKLLSNNMQTVHYAHIIDSQGVATVVGGTDF